jgi:hypothetical protein
MAEQALAEDIARFKKLLIEWLLQVGIPAATIANGTLTIDLACQHGPGDWEAAADYVEQRLIQVRQHGLSSHLKAV